MAITIDYTDPAQFVINIPKADMLLVSASPTEIRQLNIDDFRKELNDLMDDSEGMWAPTNHFHTPPLTISGVTLARVVEILDPYVIQFEDDLYNVNIVGGNSNISDKTIKNQVGVNTANSAGLQDPFALQASAFSDAVAVDVTSGITGTSFPNGTRGFPVDNLADAMIIASQRGLADILLLSDITLTSIDFSSGFTFIGDNNRITCTLEAGANVSNCEFMTLTVEGVLDGGNTLRQCVVNDITFFNGLIIECALNGTTVLGGTDTAIILSSYSLVAGGDALQYPVIDMGGNQTTPLVVRDWQGGLGLSNLTSGGAATSIDLSSGRVVLEADVTVGKIVIRGIGDVVDYGTATVLDLTLTKSVKDVRQHQRNKMITSPTAGTITLYEDDGVTVKETADLWEDEAAIQRYRGNGADRRDGFS